MRSPRYGSRIPLKEVVVHFGIECGEPDGDILVREFHPELRDPFDLFVEAVDGVVDAVRH